MKIAIRHHLSLGLGSGVARACQHLLLTAQSGPTQTVREWAIEMPGIAEAASFADGFGNRAHLVTQTKPDAELVITVHGLVDTIDRNGVIGKPAGEPPPALYRRPTPTTKAIGAITSKFRSSPRFGQDRIPLLHALMERVAQVIGGAAEQSQTQESGGQSQSQSQGSAAAERPAASVYAQAFIGAARALEVPARYVTGYLSASEDEPAAFHAWAEAWDDGLGWIGFDAMLEICPTDRHVRLAAGLDAISTMPVRSIPVVGEPQLLEMSIEAAQ